MTDSIAAVLRFPSAVATPPPVVDPTQPHVQVHCKSQLCANCGTRTQLTEIYECSTKGKTRTLSPVRALAPHLPVVAIDLPESRIPTCFSCVRAQRQTDIAERRRWEETLARKEAERVAEKSEEGSKSPRISTSLDDL